MDQHKQLANTTYLCNYHVIFCAKYRFHMFRREIGHKVREWIRKISEWKGAEIIEGHDLIDHVHLVLSIPPKYSVSQVIGAVEGRVAIRVLKHVPDGRNIGAHGSCLRGIS